MTSAPRNILFLHPNSEIGGSDVSLLRVVEGLDRARFRPVLALPADGPLVGRFAAAGCTVEIVREMRKLTSRRGYGYLAWYLVRYPSAVTAIARLVKRHQIDLIHTNTIHNLYGVGAAWLTGLPHVWHVQEIVWQSRGLRRLEVALARGGADRIIVLSAAIAAMLAEGGAPPERLRTIPNCVDLDEFRPAPPSTRVAEEWGLPQEAPLVGVACRLDAWKGVDVFLRAAALVRAAVPDARFLVVGGAIEGQRDHANHLVALAAELGLGDDVRFTSWRYAPDDMPDVYRALRVFVLPSTRPEPFGIVLIEAMASGVPTVATAQGGPLDITVEGETGLLVPPAQPGPMADAIIGLLNQPQRARELGAAGRRRAERLYGCATVVRAIERVYDELLPC